MYYWKLSILYVKYNQKSTWTKKYETAFLQTTAKQSGLVDLNRNWREKIAQMSMTALLLFLAYKPVDVLDVDFITLQENYDGACIWETA